MKKRETIELTIKKMLFPNMGIAFHEGTEVRVKHALPGQKVIAKVGKIKKTYAEARLLEIVEPRKDENPADCIHNDFCGGCSRQNLSYEHQLIEKEKAVMNLFAEHGIMDVPYRGITASPKIYRYRNKMEYTFGDMEKGGETTLGMHRKGRYMDVLTISDCLLTHTDFNRIMNETLAFCKEHGLPHYNNKTHMGLLRNLIVRKAENTGEIMVNIVTSDQIAFPEKEYNKAMESLELEGKIVGILRTVNDDIGNAVRCDELRVISGRDWILEEVGELKFKISPFSFFQTNTSGAELLYEKGFSMLGDLSDKVLYDLYSGTGTIGQLLAKKAKAVYGVELIGEAVEKANENAELNGLDNCMFYSGDVRDGLKIIPEKPDVIVLDPPREGIMEKALMDIIAYDVKEILYISCNPKTLARDLLILKENNYEMTDMALVDMFPHTPHVETVVKLQRSNR
ncbi:MAG: 23S rRNA (uracil(1939)-C(5))-methyltransferase RlmD [Peptostreptococcaceae bacterium]|nr:23S rRNA (uracil(1939)-C(5))-methyltransferase RlmD [Peptostreptococcaceae bacterium]